MKLLKTSFRFLLFIILFSSCNNQFKKEKETVSKPNVVLFLVDDMGWTDAGVYGSDLYQTPNIDKMAAEGMLFTDGYAACTVCSPTRSSIMTGKYPANTNTTDWITGHNKPFAKMQIPEWNKKLDTEEYTLAEAFKEQGYRTIHIGKWHLGEDQKYWPENQGFDVNVGGHSGGSPKANGGNGYFSPYNNPRLKDGNDGEYLTERLSSEAVKFIKENKDSTFFMNFWLYNVHTPLQAKQEKIKKYKGLVNDSMYHINPIYSAMVEHMDDALGEVINALKENGLEDNTIVVFHSDNGGLKGNFENGRKKVTDNYPLRSGKGDMYEGGVRVPLIFKWPEKIKKGTINNTPAISPDLYPTLLALTGQELRSKVDGIDLSPILLGEGIVERDAIYWHYPHYHLEGAKPYSAIRKGDWKLIQVFEHEDLELYNLKDDIGETNNLALTNKEKVIELMLDLNTWRTKVGAQFPVVNLNYDIEKENEWRFNKSATISKSDIKANKK